MKQTIYISTLIALVLGCNTQTTEKAAEKNSNDSTQTLPANAQKQNIYIKDKSQYDSTFINGLADFNNPIKLIDNYILVGNDTTFFPEDLELNKRTTFTALEDNKKFLLIVTRTNFTNINFEFQLFDINNNTIDSKSGIAILGSGFFLAPEGEPDPEAGSSFISNQYGMKNDNFWVEIKIGMDNNFDGKRRAKIIYGLKEKSKETEDVKESPILRLE